MSKIIKIANKMGEFAGAKNAEDPTATAEICSTIFECDWEVFVVKYDPSAEKFVGKMACCALAPV